MVGDGQGKGDREKKEKREGGKVDDGKVIKGKSNEADKEQMEQSQKTKCQGDGQDKTGNRQGMDYEPHKQGRRCSLPEPERGSEEEKNKVGYAQLSSLHQQSEDNQKGGNQQGSWWCVVVRIMYRRAGASRVDQMWALPADSTVGTDRGYRIHFVFVFCFYRVLSIF